MQALQVPPHSPRSSSLALAALAVVAAGAFSLGLQHQLNGRGVALQGGDTAGLRTYVDTIPEATPAREIEVAAAVPPSRPIDASLDKTSPVDISPVKDPVAVTATPATNARATVAESAPPPKRQADTEEPPT